MDYYRSDFEERQQRALAGNADFVQSIKDARDNRMSSVNVVAAGVDAMRDLMQLALRLGCSTDVAESARSCLGALRRVKPLFDYLYEYETMTKADDDATDHVLSLLDAATEDDAMRALIFTKSMPPARVANVIEGYNVRWKIAKLQPVAGALAIGKLRQLENKLKAK